MHSLNRVFNRFYVNKTRRMWKKMAERSGGCGEKSEDFSLAEQAPEEIPDRQKADAAEDEDPHRQNRERGDGAHADEDQAEGGRGDQAYRPGGGGAPAVQKQGKKRSGRHDPGADQRQSPVRQITEFGGVQDEGGGRKAALIIVIKAEDVEGDQSGGRGGGRACFVVPDIAGKVTHRGIKNQLGGQPEKLQAVGKEGQPGKEEGGRKGRQQAKNKREGEKPVPLFTAVFQPEEQKQAKGRGGYPEKNRQQPRQHLTENIVVAVPGEAFGPEQPGQRQQHEKEQTDSAVDDILIFEVFFRHNGIPPDFLQIAGSV